MQWEIYGKKELGNLFIDESFNRRPSKKCRKRAMVLEALALNYKKCQQKQIEKWIDPTRY